MEPQTDLSVSMNGTVDLAAISGIEQLEDLNAPWDWGHFFAGFGTGVAVVGVFAAGVGIAT